MRLTGSAGPRGVIWLGTNTCDGNIISTLNTYRPSLRELVRDFDFYYASLIMAAQGEKAAEAWSLPQVLQGDFILVVEGTVPTAYQGKTAIIGQVKGRNVTALELVQNLGALARYVVAAGACATFGGPYSAHPNPTGSRPVSQVLDRPVINVPGCPVNPRWVLETLYHLKEKGVPDLDPLGRPRFLFRETVHSRCEYLPHFEAGIFVKELGQQGCTYLLGCKGPSTRADCPVRLWNDEKSAWNISVNSVCIGCTSPEFPDQVSPFFHHETDIYLKPGRLNLDSLALGVGALTLAGIGSHLAGKILTGRIRPPAGAFRRSLKKLLPIIQKRMK
jgi:hydrogenase small subunit